jgi:hypothetical protein
MSCQSPESTCMQGSHVRNPLCVSVPAFRDVLCLLRAGGQLLDGDCYPLRRRIDRTEPSTMVPSVLNR